MLEEVQALGSLTPYISMLLGLVISLSAKDFITSFISGLAFKMNPLFKAGDTIIIDGEFSVVVKIGIRNTIFGITKDSGDYIWRSVPNDRVSYLKVEKIVIPKEQRRKKVDDPNDKPIDNSIKE